MKKTFLTLVALQIIITIAMAFGLIEREATFFVTAILIIFTVLSSLEDGLILFILSIPWFFALPFSDAFDGMSSWRILAVVLFLKYLAERLHPSTQLRAGFTDYRSRKKIVIRNVVTFIKEALNSKLFWLTAAFLGWGLLSSLAAPYPMAGIKKILFFLNIFLLYPVIRTIIEKEGLSKIVNAGRWLLMTVLAVGFLQLISIFIFPLEVFWRFWAGHVIPLFYGYGLGELLQTSNTWFAFSEGGPPLLRMFSVFPDSHSFAMFVILGLILLVSKQITDCRLQIAEGKKFRIISGGFMLIPGFLALIFSGSRGVWLSALGVAILLGSAFLMVRQVRDTHFIRTTFRQIILGLLLFGILFLPASFISSLSQRAQGAKADSFAALKRAKSITDLDEVSNRSRLQIWKAAAETILRYPVFGVGLGNFSVALGEDIGAAKKGASAHNLYLDIGSETGLPGFLAFVAVIGYILFRIFKNTTYHIRLRSSDSQREKAFTSERSSNAYSGDRNLRRVDYPNTQNLSDNQWAASFTRESSSNAFHAIFNLSVGVYFIWILGYSFFDVVLFNDKVLIFAVMITAMISDPTS